jgi:chromosome segregation ATPase
MKYLFISLLLLSANTYALFGDEEEIQRLEEKTKLLTVELNIAKDTIKKYEQILPTLREENTRLKVEIASLKANLNNGKLIEEEKKALDKRLQELKRFEQYLHEKDARIAKEEQELQQRRQDSFDELNATQREIGRAEQLKKDYEYMRIARNEAEAKLSTAQQQATYYSQRLVYALVVCGMIIIGLAAWVILMLSRYAKQREDIRAEIARSETEERKRRDAMHIWETQKSLPEEESKKVQAALENFLK